MISALTLSEGLAPRQVICLTDCLTVCLTDGHKRLEDCFSSAQQTLPNTKDCLQTQRMASIQQLSVKLIDRLSDTDR